MRHLRLTILLSTSASTAAYASPATPCTARGEEAMNAGRYQAAASAFQEAAANPECLTEKDRLYFNAAFALHEQAREARDSTWCAARDAYALLADAGDPEVKEAAADGARLTGQTCEVWQHGRQMALDDPEVGGAEIHQQWLYLAGGGLALLGLVFVGLGASAQWEADGLREQGTLTRDEAIEERQLEGRSSAYGVNAVVLLTAGLLTAGSGYIWALVDDEQREVEGARMEVGASVGGLILRGAF